MTDTHHTQRIDCLYSGQVQGVGFRYTTAQIARRYEVSGFVRNLPDGRVELVAEGAVSETEAFLGDIDDEMSGYIRDREIRRSDASGMFQSFEIRH